MSFRGQRRLVAAFVVLSTVAAGCSGTSAEGVTQPGSSRPAASVTSTRAAPPRWTPLDEPNVGGRVTSVWIDPKDSSHLLIGGDLLGVGVSRDGRTFTRAPIEGSEINRFSSTPDASTIWVGTMSGPFASTDGGRTWASRRQGMPALAEDHYSAPVDIVLVDPTDPTRVMALGGSHHFVREGMDRSRIGVAWPSSDAGVTWGQPVTVAKGANLTGGAVLADGTMLASADEQGLFRLERGASTWVRVAPAGRRMYSVTAHPSDPSVAWAAFTEDVDGGPGGLLRTADGGRTWSVVEGGLSRVPSPSPDQRSRYFAVAVSPSDPNRLYTVDSGWSSGHVLRSDDGGLSWRSVLDSAQLPPDRPYKAGLMVLALAVDPLDPDHVFVANEENPISTTDGGATWEGALNDKVGDGYRGLGYSGLVATAAAFGTKRGVMYLGAFDGGNIVRSVDDAKSWTRPLSPAVEWGGSYSIASGPAGAVLVLLGQDNDFGGIARSADAGATWTVAAGAGSGLPDAGTQLGDEGRPGMVLSLGGTSFLVTIGGNLLRSDDDGATWTMLHRGIGAGALAVSPVDPRRVYVMGSAGVLRSDDGGATLAPLPGLGGVDPGSATLAVAAGKGSADEIVFAGRWRVDDGGIWRWREGRWERILSDPYARTVVVDPNDARRVAVGTTDHPFHDQMRSSGVWISTDGGDNFAKLDDGLPISRVNALAFDPHREGRLVAGTEGAGFYRIDLPRS